LAILHNGVFIATLAHGLIGLSLIWDKILLERPETRSVANYVFWLGAMSVLGLCLIPFGFHWPGRALFALAFSAGVIQLAANFFYYAALEAGEASQTLAIMGGFSPLATYLIAIPLLKQPLGRESVLAFALLVGGGFLMFFSEPLDLGRVLGPAIGAAATFGLSSVMQKIAFEGTNFVSAYVAFTVGTFIGALLLLLRSKWRREILRGSEKASPRSKELYFINRFLSGVGSFLIYYGISLTSPAIVEAISGLRYVIIFVGVYFIGKYHADWLHERYRGWALIGKSAATVLVIAGLAILGISSKGAVE